MNRRAFLQTAGLAAVATSSRRALARPATRPNLLIIHTDEHNFRTLGCYRAHLPKPLAWPWRGTPVETPHIDWLAGHGALATHFYATTPVCSPSRSAFVSGRYPQNTPMTTNNIPMSDAVATFAAILAKSGYATGYAGKWHLDGTGKPQWAPQRKFGFADNRYMFNRGHWKQLEETTAGPRVKARKRGKPSYSVNGADATSFTTDWLADKAVDFIRRHKDQPFCYMVSIPDPHGPNSVRPPYDSMFDPAQYHDPPTMKKDDEHVPAWAPRQARKLRAAPFAKYLGMVRCIDDNVGKLLRTLRTEGLLDHTFVVFTADHGDLCGEHGRHNKGNPFEASAKIPFILYAPGRVKPGTVVPQALGCVDFLPTILRLMGVPTAGKEEGRDASALFLGQAPEDWKDIAFLRGTTRPGGASWLAAVTPRYKLILSPGTEPWLFDHQADPTEVRNFLRSAEHRGVIRALARELAAYAERHGDPSAKAPRIQADLAWAISDTQEYALPNLPEAPTPKAKSRRGKRKAAGKS